MHVPILAAVRGVRRVAVALIAVLMLSAWNSKSHAAEDVQLTASDGVTVFATRWGAVGNPKASILLFHQAGSNRGEYAPVAPRLAALGFDVLAIDQRSGGERFERNNETVDALGTSTEFLEALPDLETALAYAKAATPERPVIVFGSSYSAALVFLLAERHPRDVAAILAFSPGEYLGRASVASAAKTAKVPVFVTSAADQGEISAASDILGVVASQTKEQFIPEAAPHGASILRSDRNPEGSAAAWKAVERFLQRVAP